MTEDIFNKTYSCTNGHTLAPNGHNDLNLMFCAYFHSI